MNSVTFERATRSLYACDCNGPCEDHSGTYVKVPEATPQPTTGETGNSAAWDGLVNWIGRQREWSQSTFGGGSRALGIVAHIRKELAEIEAEPTDAEEWVDVVILALDGAWRAGHSPTAIVNALLAKQAKNIAREWPAPGPQDQPVEHVRKAV